VRGWGVDCVDGHRMPLLPPLTRTGYPPGDWHHRLQLPRMVCMATVALHASPRLLRFALASVGLIVARASLEVKIPRGETPAMDETRDQPKVPKPGSTALLEEHFQVHEAECHATEPGLAEFDREMGLA